MAIRIFSGAAIPKSGGAASFIGRNIHETRKNARPLSNSRELRPNDRGKVFFLVSLFFFLFFQSRRETRDHRVPFCRTIKPVLFEALMRNCRSTREKTWRDIFVPSLRDIIRFIFGAKLKFTVVARRKNTGDIFFSAREYFF